MAKEFLGFQLSSERYNWIRSIIVSSIVVSALMLFRPGVAESCLITVFQNIVLPVIGLVFFIEERPTMTKAQWYRHGIILGGVIGVVGMTLTTLVQGIDFYALGGREVVMAESGIQVIPLTAQILVRDILLLLPFCFVTVVVSMFAGLLGAVLSSKKLRWYE